MGLRKKLGIVIASVALEAALITGSIYISNKGEEIRDTHVTQRYFEIRERVNRKVGDLSIEEFTNIDSLLETYKRDKEKLSQLRKDNPDLTEKIEKIGDYFDYGAIPGAASIAFPFGWILYGLSYGLSRITFDREE